jgi:predicted alpha-1,6-mannanase (GH76 family)
MPEGGKYQARAAAGMAALHGFYDDATGLWQTTGWWNSANALEATIDHAARSGETAYTYALANTYAKNSGGSFLNDFYDDEGWWALAWMKAYDLTGDGRYLDAARTIFADMCGGWDATCAGGIWWNKGHLKKNAIANELFLCVAARLHERTPSDGGPGSALDWAQRAWSWFASSGMINPQGLVNDGLTPTCVNDGGVTWTYNQGVVLGGLIALSTATGDETLLARASSIADAALSALCGVGGILCEPNEPNLGADGPQFKGIFVRNVCELYGATNDSRYLRVILANANAIWERNRVDSCHFGTCWAGPFDRADAARQCSAMDALNAAILFDVPGTTYQAEDGDLHDLSTEALYAGYHGTGYLAGWGHDGQSVDIPVNVPATGPYDLLFRYAAIGDALRCIRLNGAVLAAKQRFPNTGKWTNWSTISLYDVALNAGANALTVDFESANGSQNWLNLDELTVQ